MTEYENEPVVEPPAPVTEPAPVDDPPAPAEPPREEPPAPVDPSRDDPPREHLRSPVDPPREHLRAVAPLPADSRESVPSNPRLARLLAALWFGAGAFILIAAAAIFRAVDSPVTAANVVGAMLTRWHYMALLIPVTLVFLLRNRARSLVQAALFTAILLASMQAFVDVRIRQIRAASPVAISALDRDDPLRRQFGMLHGLSSLLLIVQVLAAAVVVSETT